MPNSNVLVELVCSQPTKQQLPLLIGLCSAFTSTSYSQLPTYCRGVLKLLMKYVVNDETTMRNVSLRKSLAILFNVDPPYGHPGGGVWVAFGRRRIPRHRTYLYIQNGSLRRHHVNVYSRKRHDDAQLLMHMSHMTRYQTNQFSMSMQALISACMHV
jgi:hypothetical protein